MSFRSISKCCFYDSFSHCCHCFVFFFLLLSFFYSLMWHMISSCQWMQNSQSGILKKKNTVSENISHGSMGLQIAWLAHRLSDGYFYINLPPIFMCLLSVVLTYLSKRNTCYFTLHVAVLSDQEHMTTKSESRGGLRRVRGRLGSTYMLLLERELLFMWVYSKVTNCSLVCMYTFVIEM